MTVTMRRTLYLSLLSSLYLRRTSRPFNHLTIFSCISVWWCASVIIIELLSNIFIIKRSLFRLVAKKKPRMPKNFETESFCTMTKCNRKKSFKRKWNGFQNNLSTSEYNFGRNVFTGNVINMFGIMPVYFLSIEAIKNAIFIHKL